MRNFINRIPIPMSGLVLALFSLAKLLLAFDLQLVTTMLSSAGMLLSMGLVLKVVLFPKKVWQELQNPVIAAVSPTFTMAVMVASSLYMTTSQVWQMIWWCAVVLHFALMLFFTYRFVLSEPLTLTKIYPSWFIMYIGMGVMPLTAGDQAPMLMTVVSYTCMAFLLVLLPPVILRIFVLRDIEQPALPLITILCAPTSLILAGILAHFSEPSPLLLLVALILAQVLYVVVLTQLPRLLRLPFYPSYAAFTFPLVISATALLQTYEHFGYSNHFVTALIIIEATIATIMVGYVTVRYLQFLWESAKKTPRLP